MFKGNMRGRRIVPEPLPFEVTQKDAEFLSKAPKKPDDGCVYDFTYLDRFIVCHYADKHGVIYVTCDKQTGLFSRMLKSTGVFVEEFFENLIPAVKKSVKYTGIFNATAPDYSY